MLSTYLAPTETPLNSLEVKKALLTFDRVIIPDPSDRDLIPPQSFLTAIGTPAIFGFNTGPVRPLGKSADYDNEFDRLIDEIDYARRQGIVDVVSTYDVASSQQTTIGAVIMGDYPLNPGFMLWAYRNIGRDHTTLMTAISGDEELLSLSEEQMAQRAILDGQADGIVRDDPALPIIEGAFANENLRPFLTAISRSRIAAVMKAIGFCATKALIPSFGNAAFAKLALQMSSRAAAAVDEIAKFDPHWALRSQVMRVAHDEYIDDNVLRLLSIDDVLALRTHAWGVQAEARDAMLESAAKLAREAESQSDFEKAVASTIADYRSKAGDVETERRSLSFQIDCEILGLTGAASSGILAGSAPGLLTQMQTAYGAAGLLVAGCLWTLDKVKDYKPLRDQLLQAEAEFQDHAGFGIHNFYRSMSR